MSDSNNPITAMAVHSSNMADVFFDEGKFRQLQRAASLFVASPLVPEHLRGKTEKEGIANCTIALALALEMGENPLIVMQNIYFVSGKAGWSASYMIAKANSSGKFSDPLDWRIEGAGDSLSVTCFTKLAKTGKTVEMEVTMQMARDEGWTKNAKYKTLGKLMLRYRSATLLIRLYAPEVMLGYHTADELETMPTPAVTARTVSRNPLADAILPTIEPAVTQAEVVPDPSPMAQQVLAMAERLANRDQGEVPDWLPDGEAILALDDARLSALLDRLDGALSTEGGLKL